MTRRFLDNVRNDVTGTLVTGANVPGPTVAGLLIDIIDSTIQDECDIQSTAPTSGIATTPTYTALTTTYGQQKGGDGDFLKPDYTVGEIVTSTTPGFSYEVAAVINFTDLGSNDQIDFTILQNGVAIGLPGSQTGEGNNDPVYVGARARVDSAGADDVFQIGVRTPDGNETIEILDIGLTVVILPTNNP